MEKNSTIGRRQVEDKFPKTMYQFLDTYWEMDVCDDPHSDEQKAFKKMAVFDYDAIRVRAERFKNTKK